MKYFFSTLALFLGLVSIVSAQETTVSGTVNNNADVEQVRIILDKYFINGAQTQVFEATLNEGAFNIPVELDRSRVVDLVYGADTLPIYLEVGNALEVNFDAATFKDTLSFSGDGRTHNAFLWRFNKQFGTHFEDTTLYNAITEKLIDPFEIYLFQARMKQHKFLKNDEDAITFSEDFKTYIKNQINYHYHYALLCYPIYKANSKTKDLTVQRLPSIMVQELEKVEVGQADAQISAAYRNFLIYKVIYFTSRDRKYMKFTDFSESMNEKFQYAQEHLRDWDLQYFLAQYLYKDCETAKPSVARRLYNTLQSIDEEGGYTKILESRCGEHFAKSDPVEEVADNKKGKDKSNGNEAYPFDLLDREGKVVTLDDFAGKVVYIDFWASWCGPCRKQFPFAKELKAKLFDQLSKKQRKQVEFLYISIDDNGDAWQTAVDKYELEGVQLWSKGGWKSEVCKFFQINSIPRYMLMDKKGKMVLPKAPRPSDMDKVIEAIMKLL